MSKAEREKEASDAIKIGQFVIWSRSLKDVKGIALVNPEIREMCEAAGEFIVETMEEARLRRIAAQEKGRKGGRPKTKNPAKATIRSRKFRANKK